MSFHDYGRKDLYEVSTERLIRRKLVLRKSFWPWSKKCTVREYVVYECVGRHPTYMGWYSFVEEDYTGYSKRFNTVEEAEEFMKKELSK